MTLSTGTTNKSAIFQINNYTKTKFKEGVQLWIRYRNRKFIFYVGREKQKGVKWSAHLALNIPRGPPRSCPFGNSFRNSWVSTTGTPILWSSNSTDTSSLSTESTVASWYLRIKNYKRNYFRTDPKNLISRRLILDQNNVDLKLFSNVHKKDSLRLSYMKWSSHPLFSQDF